MWRRLAILIILCLGSLTVLGQDIDWVSLQVAQTKASEGDKKVLIFAEAEWCGYCQKMDEKVFRIEAVTDSLKNTFMVYVSILSHDTVSFNGERFSKQSLARKFRALRTPTTIFLDTDGSFIGLQPGFIPGKIYDKLLAYIGAERYENQSFEEYLRDHSIEEIFAKPAVIANGMKQSPDQRL